MTNWLNLARAISQLSTCKTQVGAVIVRHGTPVSAGCNQPKTHPQFANGSHCTLHAEIVAVLNANCNLRGSTVYVYRQHANGVSALARPCVNCLAVLAAAGIKWCCYSTNSYPNFQTERIPHAQNWRRL